ncbi:hypothetical protein [Streptococcus sanguinis]|uniref:hypothetical protein n=1 Tax=Streptococcus sanguinis TaxID=1305 RepID=UPI000F67D88F|nr:hypothetical protein [Streptococcus sanguinis]RSI35881.1 hypothetical protein D8876_04145 [Streptococcus sanguinis]
MIKIFNFFHKRLDYVIGFTAGPALFATVLYSVKNAKVALVIALVILLVVGIAFITMPANTPEEKQKRKECVESATFIIISFVVAATVYNLMTNGFQIISDQLY